MRYKSKVNSWFYSILIASIVIVASFAIIYLVNQQFIFLAISGCVAIDIVCVLIPMYIRTYYIFDDDHLKVRSGLLFNLRIPYRDISSIEEVKSIIFSAALSSDRIKITYLFRGKQKSIVFVSPENRAEFLRELDIMLNQSTTV